jgi:mannitol-1-phosphate 5-dehydrogenase
LRVVIVGTGRIGCGYLAPLFSAEGWDVVLGARTESSAQRIQAARSFRVVQVGAEDGERDEQEVRNLPAVAVDRPELGDAVATADLVCVSVGVANVVTLAPSLARALARRTAPIDVWVVENANAAPRLEAAVDVAATEARLCLPEVGFAGAVASVAIARGGWGPGAVPEFVGDSARVLAVDATRLSTALPSLPGVEGTCAYGMRLLEKLFVFNAGHAIAGYLGWLRRHATVHQAVADPFLRPIVVGCMLESRRAIVAAHPDLDGDVDGPVGEALRRFANPALADPVTRVARDPIRKLRPDDRLLGPVDLIRKVTGTVPAYFALSVAGALLYRGPGDVQAEELEQRLQDRGVMPVLEEVCALEPDDPFAIAVATRYRGFAFDDDETLFPPVHAGEMVGAVVEGR